MALPIPAFLTRLAAASLLMAASLSAVAGALSSVSVVPADNSTGVVTSYTFTYTVETQVTQDQAVFFVSFPPEFTLGAGSACDWTTITLDTPDDPPTAATCNGAYGSGNTRGVAVNTMAFGGPDVPVGTVVEIVVSDVTNPALAGDYVFDPSATPNFDTGIRTVMSPGDFMPMEIDVAPQQTVTIGAGGVVNGACGGADGGLFTTTPAASLCTTGTASAVTDNPTTFTWDCAGSGGGTDDSCSANLGHELILSISPPSGGSVNCTANPVIDGGNTTCTPTASAGYTFANWSGDCTGATCVLNGVTSSLNPQANFTLNSYAITGTVSPVGAGSGVTCTNNPVDHGTDSSCSYSAPNAGYTFANWSGDCTGATCDLVGVTGAKSVTANFTAPSFAITTAVAPVGAGTAICNPNPVNGGNNASCSATANAGYTFTGWTGDCTGGSCVLAAVASAKSVTANFALNSYSVSGSAAPAAGGSVNCTGSVNHGSSASCTATANSGYNLTGWSGCPNVNGINCDFSNVTANQNVTANFALNSYTVSASVSPVSAGSASCNSPVNHGSTSSCTATAASGFVFANWSGDCTGSSCSLSNVTANKAVVANFAVATYSLAGVASLAAGGSISCTSPISHGGSGTCTATAATGYTLGSWSGCSSSAGNSCTVANITANKTVWATFVINSYTVSAVANPIDAGSATCTSPVEHGDSTSCAANPAAGYRLKDWSGACTGSICAIASVTANSAVTANFELLPTYNVSTSVSPADSGRISCTKDILEGSSATCSAIAKDGFEFTGWGGDCAGTELRCEIPNVTANKSVSATFAQTQATGFNITVGFINAVGKPEANAIAGDQICSAPNPVAGGTTVRCNVDKYRLPDGNTFRGWEGGCTKVEGRTCIIENMASDKRLTIKMGSLATDSLSNLIKVKPAGAGSVWCTQSWANLPLFSNTITDYCQAEANQGYAFEAFVKTCSGMCSQTDYYLEARFKSVPNIPVVVCESCNTSTTDTFTSTTKTSSTTSTPDANGTSTQSTVATTTNTQTGQTNTQIIVAPQNTNSGVVTQPTTTNITDPNLQIQVNPGGSVGFTSNNLNTGMSTSGSIGGSGFSGTTGVGGGGLGGGLGGGGLGGGLGSTVNAGSGSSVTLGQSAQGTNVQVTTSGGQTTSVNTSPDSTTITTGQNQQQVTGTSSTTNVTDSGTSTTAPINRNGQSMTSNVVDVSFQSGSFGPQGITTSAPLVPGATVIVSACCYVPGTTVTFTLRSSGVTGNNIFKPGRHSKTANAEEERVINIDMGTGELVSIGLGSANQPFFTAQPNDPLAPIATGYEVDEESFDLTLTFPAAN